jgi:hypothetical protein
MQESHVRIDRVAQGPTGQEHVVDRFAVDHQDFLWIYVDASLPGGAAPEGEYYRLGDVTPAPDGRVRLSAPDRVGDFFRFSVAHFTLSDATRYLFHFADRLAAPAFEDAWEVLTLADGAGLVLGGSLTDASVRNALRYARAMERLVAPRPRFSVDAPTAGPLVVDPPTAPADPVILGAVPQYWMRACQGGDAYENNCAHYLSDAMIRAGFAQLNPPSDCINARCNTSRKRPIRARDMWCWFKTMATSTNTAPTKGTGIWAVFQLDEAEYWGGHVVLLDSDSWLYYGTAWYHDWDQYLYKW